MPSLAATAPGGCLQSCISRGGSQGSRCQQAHTSRPPNAPVPIPLKWRGDTGSHHGTASKINESEAASMQGASGVPAAEDNTGENEQMHGSSVQQVRLVLHTLCYCSTYNCARGSGKCPVAKNGAWVVVIRLLQSPPHSHNFTQQPVQRLTMESIITAMHGH